MRHRLQRLESADLGPSVEPASIRVADKKVMRRILSKLVEDGTCKAIEIKIKQETTKIGGQEKWETHTLWVHADIERGSEELEKLSTWVRDSEAAKKKRRHSKFNNHKHADGEIERIDLSHCKRPDSSSHNPSKRSRRDLVPGMSGAEHSHSPPTQAGDTFRGQLVPPPPPLASTPEAVVTRIKVEAESPVMHIELGAKVTQEDADEPAQLSPEVPEPTDLFPDPSLQSPIKMVVPTEPKYMLPAPPVHDHIKDFTSNMTKRPWVGKMERIRYIHTFLTDYLLVVESKEKNTSANDPGGAATTKQYAVLHDDAGDEDAPKDVKVEAASSKQTDGAQQIGGTQQTGGGTVAKVAGTTTSTPSTMQEGSRGSSSVPERPAVPQAEVAFSTYQGNARVFSLKDLCTILTVQQYSTLLGPQTVIPCPPDLAMTCIRNLPEDVHARFMKSKPEKRLQSLLKIMESLLLVRFCEEACENIQLSYQLDLVNTMVKDTSKQRSGAGGTIRKKFSFVFTSSDLVKRFWRPFQFYCLEYKHVTSSILGLTPNLNLSIVRQWSTKTRDTSGGKRKELTSIAAQTARDAKKKRLLLSPEAQAALTHSLDADTNDSADEAQNRKLLYDGRQRQKRLLPAESDFLMVAYTILVVRNMTLINTAWDTMVKHMIRRFPDLPNRDSKFIKGHIRYMRRA